MSIADLASATSISPASLEKAIAGRLDLTFPQLNRVADYFGRGVLFFLDESPVEIEHVHTPAFRTITNQKPGISLRLRSLIERAEKQREIYLGLREELGYVNVPFCPPDMPKDINLAATVARAWLGLSNENSFEGYRSAIERKGILAFRSNGYNGKWQVPKESQILGFSLYDNVCPIIFVRKQEFDARQTFTLMHELGHILLHRKSTIDDDDDLWSIDGPESEANSFAGKVLVPDSFLKEIVDSSKPDEASEFENWLYPQKRRWGVSTELILRRLLDSGRLERHEYTAYRNWRSSLPPVESAVAPRMYRHREPKNIFGDRFVRTVLDSLSAKNITLSKASTYLDGLRINDLHKLEDHYAGS
ncbi:ImmA/IrrE family metallo-endopeptidase [Pseudomonas phenolilytica]|uniref:ImmA/IrrE family metallo-endopeptidase n=1 Tax=Pseudomonas phenolilytica TaxID=2746321 RepID=UPI001F1B84AC|nr:ImmA/IrrE family metallo-endopeptidase [Pseudomonas phenolilytica]